MRDIGNDTTGKLHTRPELVSLRSVIGGFHFNMYEWGVTLSVPCKCDTKKQTQFRLFCGVPKPTFNGEDDREVLGDKISSWLLKSCYGI